MFDPHYQVLRCTLLSQFHSQYQVLRCILHVTPNPAEKEVQDEEHKSSMCELVG